MTSGSWSNHQTKIFRATLRDTHMARERNVLVRTTRTRMIAQVLQDRMTFSRQYGHLLYDRNNEPADSCERAMDLNFSYTLPNRSCLFGFLCIGTPGKEWLPALQRANGSTNVKFTHHILWTIETWLSLLKRRRKLL